MNATSTILSPKDCLTTFEPEISLVIPVLLLVVTSPPTVVVVVLIFPPSRLAIEVVFAQRPDQLVCQLFQTVPKLLFVPARLVIVSNKLLSFTIKSGLLVVSYHSSTSGVNATSP